ncbi:MAG: DNA translocase FtsK 4TM domain-containing protein, partial [Lentisphaeria bacterium]|nr:DNA translocase FtsK 4TM domain-containing protein [Lentisphaeria bacterium]NQZ70378.1 DNA translocase FtsK 4TM domain-containing protein [Lentisphaeria bacterium]
MAVSQTQSISKEGNSKQNPLLGIVAKAFAILATFILSLTLLSYNPDDISIVQRGIGDHAIIHNWIGRCGAWISYTMISWFGLAVYPLLVLLIISVSCRVYGKRLRPLSTLYFVGIAISVFALSMLLGIFPQFMPALCDYLNITSTPGGVIGQRFCAPAQIGSQAGWMSYIVNPTGSLIISFSIMVISVIIVGWFDWHGHLLLAFEKIKASGVETEDEEELIDKNAKTVVKEKFVINQPEVVVAPPEKKEKTDETEPIQAKPKVVKAKKPKALIIPPDEKDIKDLQPIAAVDFSHFRLPSLKLLNDLENKESADPAEMHALKDILQSTLENFGIDATVVGATRGPRVTMF